MQNLIKTKRPLIIKSLEKAIIVFQYFTNSVYLKRLRWPKQICEIAPAFYGLLCKSFIESGPVLSLLKNIKISSICERSLFSCWRQNVYRIIQIRRGNWVNRCIAYAFLRVDVICNDIFIGWYLLHLYWFYYSILYFTVIRCNNFLTFMDSYFFQFSLKCSIFHLTYFRCPIWNMLQCSCTRI